MGAAIGIIGAIAGAADVGMQIYESTEEEAMASAQEEGLRIKGVETKNQAAQAAIARDDKIKSIQSAQRARAAASGMDLSSGTYSALSTASYNKFAQDTKSANLNLATQEAEINTQISAVHSQLSSELWGNVFKGVGDVAGMASFAKSGSNQAPEQKNDWGEAPKQTYQSGTDWYDVYKQGDY